jgi:hypothetical protein
MAGAFYKINNVKVTPLTLYVNIFFTLLRERSTGATDRGHGPLRLKR